MFRHADVELMAGDDWAIPFSLTNASGAPLDLSAATLDWILLDPDGNAVATLTPTINVTAPATAGKGSVVIPSAVTELLPGRYTDALRVSIAGVESTASSGWILVDADAFAPPPPVPVPTQNLADPFIIPPWWWQLPYANTNWFQWPYANNMGWW